jgi:putative hemolysin
VNEDKKQGLIDVKAVIANKNPRLLQLMPSFVLSYIQKVLHQDELNQLIISLKKEQNFSFIDCVLKEFEVHVTSGGEQNIPREGACIFVCNHPLGGLDGIAVMQSVSHVRKDQKAIVNDILMEIQNLKDLLVPTNKHGRNTSSAVHAINQAYASTECLILFPAGLVSRKQNGKIQDLTWKKSFVRKAIEHQQLVIPVFVKAENSSFFYKLARLRKWLGIKANLEMFFLVDEVFKQKGKNIHIQFGKAIESSFFTSDKTHEEWAEEVKSMVYNLGQSC